jgi:glycosyltransferase involved in cell wall biosynthesis
MGDYDDVKVSVIVRCRNEERYIGHCLQSLDDYLTDPEIILLNDNSTDNSMRIANTFDWMNIKKININNDEYLPGKSLNIGVQESSNSIIIIFSAHCELVKFDWDETVSNLNDDGSIAVWGKQIPIWDGKRVTPRYIWSNFGDKLEFNYYCESEKRYFLHNAFSIYWKRDLEKFPFDERLSGKEDRYWANDRIKEGHQIIYNPNLTVKHHYTINGATWKGTG